MKKYRVRSFSGGEDHIVVWNDFGEYECDCIASMMKPHKFCNHVLTVQGKPTKYDLELKDKWIKEIMRFRKLQIKLNEMPISRAKAIEKMYAQQEKTREKILKLRDEYKKPRFKEVK